MDSQGNSKSNHGGRTVAPLRFAVLRHETPDMEAAGSEKGGGVHWDLLVEPSPAAEALVTWRVLVPPEDWAGRLIEAVRLPDHRRRYLEYEGDISDNRGRVTRVDEGTVELHALSAAGVECTLRGRRLITALHAVCQGGARWTLDFASRSRAAE